jgi:hypothetical protein
MEDKRTTSEPRPPAAADDKRNAANDKRNEVLRTQGRAPETPVPGYRFEEAVCLTPRCGGRVKYEVSTTAPWRLNNDHVICGRCAATYKVTLANVDAPTAQVTFRNADDRQS